MARVPKAIRRAMTRVDDPLGNGLRVNRPGGWLSDQGSWVLVGPQRPDRVSPFAWQGSDAGYGWVGPGSWAGMPNGFDGDVASIVVPAVERCTQVIVNSVIRTGWNVTGPHGVEDLPLWVTDPMLVGSAPGPVAGNTPAMNRLTATDFWGTYLTHALWYGLGVVAGVEASDGGLVAGTLRLLNPFLVTFDPARGWLVGDPADPLVVPFNGRFDVAGQSWRLLPLRGVAPNDGTLPQGVLTRHWDTLQVGVDVRSYLSEAMLSGNQPTGFLKVSAPSFTADQAQALKDAWTAAHGSGSRSVAVLNATTDYTPIVTTTPKDAAGADLTHVSRSDVALLFGLDPIWVGEGAGGLTYNNASDRRRDLVDLTSSQWGAKLMEALSALMPYGTRVEVDWQSFVIPLTATATPTPAPAAVPPLGTQQQEATA